MKSAFIIKVIENEFGVKVMFDMKVAVIHFLLSVFLEKSFLERRR